MIVQSFEAITKQGRIYPPDDVQLPDGVKVYVVVPNVEVVPVAQMQLPSSATYADNGTEPAAPVYRLEPPQAQKLLERITYNPQIYAGKPIIRGRRMAVEHILGMLAAGDMVETILEEYPWLEPEDIPACFLYAYRLARNELVDITYVAPAPQALVAVPV